MSRETQAFRLTLKTGYGDSFNGRRVQPTSLMAFLEEAAAGHCESIGQDIFLLLERGQGWVLTGGFMNMFRYPDYGETITIETWISEWKRFSGIREYRILAAGGEIIGEAGGKWVYWDVGIRKPVPVPEVFRDTWFFCRDIPHKRMYPESTESLLPESGDFGRSGEDEESQIRLVVRRGDVDLYGHLHNTCYMDWLMEAVSENLYRNYEPGSMGIRFYGEARLGDEVTFSTRTVTEGMFHEVRREKDGKLLAGGYTDWREKSEGLSA